MSRSKIIISTTIIDEMALVPRLQSIKSQKLIHESCLILKTSERLAQFSSRSLASEKTTHFGFKTINEAEKDARVAGVFSNVAASYDTMNDYMSLGIHRLWKDNFVRSINPGFSSSLPPRPWTMLDIAGGTGDIGFRLLRHCDKIHNSHKSILTISDVNPEMLAEGKKRSFETPYANSPRLKFMFANAECLKNIDSNSIDLYTVAFGIRNFTNKEAALAEAFRVLKPGGVFACLEFSHVTNPLLNSLYKRWSFGVIPLLGQLVAADRASYQYLVESIEQFPRQEVFRNMIQKVGFEVPGKGWEDLTGGIAAIHKGIKPMP